MGKRRVDGGAEGKIRDTSRAGGGVNSDRTGDRGIIKVAKADGDEVVDKEESGANGEAATAGFERSVVRTAGNMSRGGHQFGRTEE